MTQKIAVIVGSLRKESLNRKVAKALIALAPNTMVLDIIDIGELPFYNEDLDNGVHTPEAWINFREQMQVYDGVLFVTPEYNRSIPAVLKNAIDVGSRPYGKGVWNGKPTAIMSVSPGAVGGFGAHHHLRQSLACLNVPLLPKPEAYIGQAHGLFNEAGQLIKEDTQQFFKAFMETFALWLTTIQAKM